MHLQQLRDQVLTRCDGIWLQENYSYSEKWFHFVAGTTNKRDIFRSKLQAN